jgi:23S rRNA pseudouridine1911/1915/1917 synthase
MHSLGCFIVGDPLYGSSKINKELNLNQQLLHAYSLHFEHPFTKEKLSFHAPIRDEMKSWILSLIPESQSLQQLK